MKLLFLVRGNSVNIVVGVDKENKSVGRMVDVNCNVGRENDKL